MTIRPLASAARIGDEAEEKARAPIALVLRHAGRLEGACGRFKAAIGLAGRYIY
jgi:hypothetical protein